MDHFVPEFDVDEDYINPPSSVLPKEKNVHDDEVLELLWQNGQVVVQSQNPRLQRKSSPPPHKFLPEDEMMSWLQYPLEDPPFNRELNDLFSLPPPGPPPPPPPPFPPSLPHHRETQIPFQPDSGALESCRTNEMRESMVDSSDTPAIRQKPNFPVITRDSVEIKNRRNRFRDSFSGADGCGIGRNSMSGVSREVDTCDLTMTSSPGGRSGASLSGTATADLMTLPPADDRRRKGRELVDEANTEYQSEDAEIESYEPKQQTRGGATKRSRAAEVHNQSERRRRDRINEKMKALQELVPRCSKTDKASMLDEAIEYLKSLQMQVQMMSMGCGMVPVMFPGVQQYMLSMGMGMGMGVGMPQQMMPFPGVLSGSAMPTQGAASHLNQRFPFQGFQMPPIPETDPARIQQPSNQAEFIMPRIPSLPDPYQQCTNIQQMPVQITQIQPRISKPSANRGCKDSVNPSTG